MLNDLMKRPRNKRRGRTFLSQYSFDSMDSIDEGDKEISDHVLAFRNRPPRNKRRGRTYLAQYSFDSMDEDF